MITHSSHLRSFWVEFPSGRIGDGFGGNDPQNVAPNYSNPIGYTVMSLHKFASIELYCAFFCEVRIDKDAKPSQKDPKRKVKFAYFYRCVGRSSLYNRCR